ncbi:MAG: phosphatidylserine decarboxylase-domain-containing protein [Benniella sp.]|nr:MAG: phosphatidylserine decarboxylase-domain-containing protein [Benniella sp.]
MAIRETRLFDGGILTSANLKKWYYTSIPIDWIQKFSSEHRFGNFVITNRKTGAKSWEDMPIYARIGMHLLFACMVDHRLLKHHRIQHLLSVESVNQGKHFDAPESVAHIANFIKTYKLELTELLQPDPTKYTSFNEFFYRRLRPDARPIYEQENPNVIVSSADCRLCVFESISAATQVWIKGKSFSVEQLVQDAELAAKFEGGSIALFRLAPQDYHRFHSPVTGTIVNDPHKVDGTYFTVNPMAVNADVNVFTENVRKVTIIDLEQQEKEGQEEAEEKTRNDHFDQCIYVSIGALLVGSIQLTGAGAAGNKVKKGDELGYFAYGGSTCLLLFKAGAVRFDEDLVASSLKGLETLVRVGERIGERQ